ncbi:MAG: TRAP transporter large permease [Kiritimatiellae bacterium]|nr:TRAP transporter large permease [Kiritimatiellia bacterium]
MEPQVLILVACFVLLLLMNVPVAVAIGLSSFLTIVSIGGVPAGYIVAQRMSSGVASFPLLAIPFFILAGLLMAEGGMARRLMDFAAALAGRFSGGLAYVNTLTCMMFGAISGSAAAAVSSIGGFMIPEMERKGYGREFSVAVTTTSAVTGLLIPPSNVMIVYAMVAGNVSVAALFMAGILPGIAVGLSIAAVSWILMRGRPRIAGSKAGAREVFRAFRKAFLSLLLVVIVLGGILGGWFSPTEAAAISVAYALFLAVGVYREVAPRELPGILLKAGRTTAVVMLLVGTSQAMSWVLAYEGIPQAISAALLETTQNKYAILLLMNVVLLLVGTVMDMTPAVLIFTPIFLPAATAIGMDPVHFGIMMIANLCIGLCTPPVGTCLFLGCGIGRTTIARATGSLVPFFAGMAVSLLVITYWPWLSLAVPRWLGLL